MIGVVLVNAPTNQTGMVVLERAKFGTLAGRNFVMGWVPNDEPDSWVRGLPAAVSWDHVGYYLIFDSYDEYKKRVKVVTAPWWRRALRRVFA